MMLYSLKEMVSVMENLKLKIKVVESRNYIGTVTLVFWLLGWKNWTQTEIFHLLVVNLVFAESFVNIVFP